MKQERMEREKEPEKASGCKVGMLICLLLIVTCILGVILGAKLSTTTPKDIVSTTVPPVPAPGTSHNSHHGEYRYAAAATDYGPCSSFGVDMMARGVSTVDAALTTLICQGATHFHSCGIGGGHFMTIYDRKTKEAVAIIAREQAPSNARADMYVNNTAASSRGGLAVGIPNELRGIRLAYERYGGSVSWKELFQPSIDLCRRGFEVSRSLAEAISLSWDSIDEDFRVLLTNQDGTRMGEGDILRRALYASTLETIANEGFESFYNGSLTLDILSEIKESGGIITAADLLNSSAVERSAVSSTLKNGNLTVYGPPPPSSGAVVQFTLGILDGYGMSEQDAATNEETVLASHRFVEALKFAFGKRSTLGDADFVDTTELIKNMTDGDFTTYYRQKIMDDKTMPLKYYEPDFLFVEDHGTSHMCILGPDGSAVSITTTVNYRFGGKVRGRKTGIIYNNQMDDFSTPGLVNFFGLSPSPSNFIEPWKRPMSSMSPTVVVDGQGDVVMMAGASGGTRIISATAQAIVRSLWWAESIKQAVDEPRFHDQLLPNDTYYEPAMHQYLQRGLAGKGHSMTARPSGVGAAQTIRVSCPQGCNNCARLCVSAVSDGRKGGYPDGY